ncbi:MAG TPA: TolC family protein [Bryobacteraceae bacterium]
MREFRSIVIFILLAGAAGAQTAPPQSVPSSSRPITLPLSGRAGQSGGVAPVQSTVSGGVPSVNIINSTVQVQGPYQGSVPSADAPGPPLSLSLDDAVKRGLQYNLGAVGLANAVRQAQGMHTVERSTLLPNISGDLLLTDQQINLAALGFTGFPGIPTVVGPFHYFDLRAGAAQSVFDLTRLRNYRASRENVHSTQLLAQDARDLVTLAVVGGYLQVVASSARVTSARAQVATAQAAYQQALDRFNAGVAPRIDAIRTQVELQTQQQRLTSVENDLAKLKINLGRLIGLPPGQDYSLSDALPYAPLTDLRLDQALARAYAYRSDLKAADAQMHTAELARDAASAERYPSVQVSADYGVIGPSPQNSHGTFGVTGSVRFPIWQGGRIRGEVEQADAGLQQRRAEFQDLRGRIDAEVRSAFLDLTSAASQVTVAQSNRDLAGETLTQARDRFAAGVADTLEVVQAQESVAAAEQDYISSLYAHNLAKASLARAMGQADQNIKQFLGKP